MSDSAESSWGGGERDLEDLLSIEHLTTPQGFVEHTFYVRNSDRVVFRRCRRKHEWGHSNRGNRAALVRSNPLWLGSGVHHALEDFHGYRKFDRASAALEDYVQAWRRASRQKDSRAPEGGGIPGDWEALQELGVKMLDYYQDHWLQNRDPLVTYTNPKTGLKCVEVKFEIDITSWIPEEVLRESGYQRVLAQGTIDRVVVDGIGRLWLLDYKTAKSFTTTHFDTDPQISMYCWAASILYPSNPIAGFIYQQHRKRVPEPPKFLSSSKMFSVAKNQATTRPLYRQALLDLYGSVERAPTPNVEFLNYLASVESERADSYVRRDFVERNAAQLNAEGLKLVAEVCDMLDPARKAYPNPTRDCSWDCPFQTACISLDDGSDWQYELESGTTDRTEENIGWKEYLRHPLRAAE